MPRAITEIDLGALEEECVRQVKLYHKYAKFMANAKLDLAEIKSAVEVTKAEAARAIRRRPKKYGLEKETEAAVKEALVTHPKYIKAQDEVIRAEHRVDVLTGFLRTLEHRKSMIENVITLHGQDYFAKPRPRKGVLADEIRDSFDREEKRKIRTKKRK